MLPVAGWFYKTRSSILDPKTGLICMIKKPTKSESSEQTTLVARVRNFHPDLVLMSIPNGGKREVRVAVQMKREGVLPGAPDLFLAEPGKSGQHGLFIEMKKVGGKTSSNQDVVIDLLRAKGYEVLVCEGADKAYRGVLNYIYGDQPPEWLTRFLRASDRD